MRSVPFTEAELEELKKKTEAGEEINSAPTDGLDPYHTMVVEREPPPSAGAFAYQFPNSPQPKPQKAYDMKAKLLDERSKKPEPAAVPYKTKPEPVQPSPITHSGLSESDLKFIDDYLNGRITPTDELDEVVGELMHYRDNEGAFQKMSDNRKAAETEYAKKQAEQAKKLPKLNPTISKETLEKYPQLKGLSDVDQRSSLNEVHRASVMRKINDAIHSDKVDPAVKDWLQTYWVGFFNGGRFDINNPEATALLDRVLENDADAISTVESRARDYYSGGLRGGYWEDEVKRTEGIINKLSGNEALLAEADKLADLLPEYMTPEYESKRAWANAWSGDPSQPILIDPYRERHKLRMHSRLASNRRKLNWFASRLKDIGLLEKKQEKLGEDGNKEFKVLSIEERMSPREDAVVDMVLGGAHDNYDENELFRRMSSLFTLVRELNATPKELLSDRDKAVLGVLNRAWKKILPTYGKGVIRVVEASGNRERLDTALRRNEEAKGELALQLEAMSKGRLKTAAELTAELDKAHAEGKTVEHRPTPKYSVNIKSDDTKWISDVDSMSATNSFGIKKLMAIKTPGDVAMLLMNKTGNVPSGEELIEAYDRIVNLKAAVKKRQLKRAEAIKYVQQEGNLPNPGLAPQGEKTKIRDLPTKRQGNSVRAAVKAEGVGGNNFAIPDFAKDYEYTNSDLTPSGWWGRAGQGVADYTIGALSSIPLVDIVAEKDHTDAASAATLQRVDDYLKQFAPRPSEVPWWEQGVGKLVPGIGEAAFIDAPFVKSLLTPSDKTPETFKKVAEFGKRAINKGVLGGDRLLGKAAFLGKTAKSLGKLGTTIAYTAPLTESSVDWINLTTADELDELIKGSESGQRGLYDGTDREIARRYMIRLFGGNFQSEALVDTLMNAWDNGYPVGFLDDRHVGMTDLDPKTTVGDIEDAKQRARDMYGIIALALKQRRHLLEAPYISTSSAAKYAWDGLADKAGAGPEWQFNDPLEPRSREWQTGANAAYYTAAAAWGKGSPTILAAASALHGANRAGHTRAAVNQADYAFDMFMHDKAMRNALDQARATGDYTTYNNLAKMIGRSPGSKEAGDKDFKEYIKYLESEDAWRDPETGALSEDWKTKAEQYVKFVKDKRAKKEDAERARWEKRDQLYQPTRAANVYGIDF